jgi:hypothetical protein
VVVLHDAGVDPGHQQQESKQYVASMIMISKQSNGRPTPNST